MKTTKTETSEHGTSAESWKKEELALAHEIHGLAQLVHARIATTYPWVVVTPRGFPAEAPQTAFAGAWSFPAPWSCCP